MRVFSHSLIFFIQSMIYVLGNAVYQKILIMDGIISADDTSSSPTYIGVMISAFFVGKLFSDPFWGHCRDRIGDKPTILIVCSLLFISLISFGLMSGLILMMINLVFIGFCSGMYIPATAFINWASPEDRETLTIFINIANAAGALLGPFLGTIMMKKMPNPKILFTWGSVGCLMMIFTFFFLVVFRDVDSENLMEATEYTKLEKIHTEEIKREKVNSKVRESELNSNLSDPNNEKESSRSEINRSKIYDTSAWISDHDANEIEKKLFLSRKRVSKMTEWEIVTTDIATRNMIIIYGISWMVKVLDWLLLTVWFEVKEKEGGIGFDSVKTSMVSVFSLIINSILILLF